MENFEKTFEAMVQHFFNINLFGPSGCGKTFLLNKVLTEKNRYNFFVIRFILYLITRNNTCSLSFLYDHISS